MAVKKHIFSWILFAALCLMGSLVLLLPGYRFSAWVTFAAAAVVLCYRLLNLLSRRYPKCSLWLRRAMTLCLCLGLLAAAATGFFILRAGGGQTEEDCDYLIVLGAGVNGTVPSLSLRERLDATCDYLQAHPDTVCIVSGGQGPGEDITEAQCMADWLIGKGISPERIIREDKATTTHENLRYSMALATQHRQGDVGRVGIVSSEYHLFRASLMAKDQGIDPILIPAKTSWVSLRLNYYMREIAATWFYLIFGG